MESLASYLIKDLIASGLICEMESLFIRKSKLSGGETKESSSGKSIAKAWAFGKAINRNVNIRLVFKNRKASIFAIFDLIIKGSNLLFYPLFKMKYLRILSFILIIFFFSSFQPLNNSKFYVKTIVLDAGHGGHDPGAVYGGINEKDVALAITLELGRILKENMPDVRVLYTRDKDEFIGLKDRAEFANKNNANVFMSIHCNAVDNTSPHGTETIVMGVSKTEASLNLAIKENSVITLEENYEEKYEGFDPNSPEAYIIFSLYQNAYREQSLNLAAKIEKDFETRVGRKSRGVKEAGLMVLWRSSMPSVLIETGFISNQKEREFLTSKTGQVYIASAIFRAFRDYRKEIEEN
jgi:N-acetylmuramoyl-L-alanine amidase